MREVLFETFHKKQAFQIRLQQAYADRWSQPPVALPVSHLKALTSLQEIGKHLPLKIMLANLRWQLNGFHTARRYQNQHTPCLFCKSTDAQDSIEHIACCRAVRQLFPIQVDPSKIAPLLFLIEGSNWEKLVSAVFVYMLYFLHNEIRHDSSPHDIPLKLRVKRFLMFFGGITSRQENSRVTTIFSDAPAIPVTSRVRLIKELCPVMR